MTVGSDPDAPTLGEIARVVYAIQQDIRIFRGEHVRSDVYSVAHSAMLERVRELEGDIRRADEARSAYQRMAVGALIAAALSIVVQFVQSQA